MNAVELFHQDGRPAGVFFCHKCRAVKKDKADADSCCEPKICPKCGGDMGNYHAICSACWTLDRQAKENERMAKADKLEVWGGPVYHEGFGDNEWYFANLDELLDYAADNGYKNEPETLPEYVFVCNEIPFKCYSFGSFMEHTCDGMFEGHMDFIKGEDSLKLAFKRFEAMNKELVSWDVDYTRAVKVPRE